MPIGAALGGVAQGASQGLGRFSHALMQVMGSQQRRRQMGQQQAHQAEERAYRRQRDMVSDEANAEARAMQTRTMEARAKEDQRRFDLSAASQGFMPAGPSTAPPAMDSRVAPPVGLGPAGMGGPRTADQIAGPEPRGVGSSIANQFMFGDKAYTRAAPQPFDLGTDPAYQRSKALASHQEGLRSNRPGAEPTGLSPERKRALKDASLADMTGEDGKIDRMRLPDVINNMRSRGAPQADIDFVIKYYETVDYF